MKFLKPKMVFWKQSQVCVSAVHPDMMYNPDNWDFICYFGGHFVFQFWKGNTKNRAWHGADLESAYPNCVKTTAWQILLRNAWQTLRMPLFEKWALTISRLTICHEKQNKPYDALHLCTLTLINAWNWFWVPSHGGKCLVTYPCLNNIHSRQFLDIKQGFCLERSEVLVGTYVYNNKS